VLNKPEKLLQESTRFWELLIGYACAAISIAAATLLAWLVYLVTWRNPREYGVHDSFKVSTIIIFFVLLVIVAGFSVLAFRLITPKSKHPMLISPMLLRIWGAFFAVGSVAVLITCIVNQRWTEIWNTCELLVGSVSMALAAFALARKHEQKFKNEIQPENPIKTSLDSK
jgi:uncharacterized protein YacL